MRWIALLAVAFSAACSPAKGQPVSPPPEESVATDVPSAPVEFGSSRATPDGRAVKLAFVTNNASAYWKIAIAGVKKYEEEAGVAVSVKTPGSGTHREQNDILKRLVQGGYDAIALSAIAPTEQTPVLDAVASKVKLVTFDADAPASKRHLFVGTDNVSAGKVFGGQIAKLLPNGGKVALFVGARSADNAKQRLSGIESAIAGKKIEIVDVREDGVDRGRARSNVIDAVKAHPDLALVGGLWSYNGPAIVSALEHLGNKTGIKVVAFDEEEGTLDGIAKGTVVCTVVQRAFQFGYLSSKWMHELATDPEAMGKLPTTRFIDSGVDVIDAKNVHAFKKRIDDWMR